MKAIIVLVILFLSYNGPIGQFMDEKGIDSGSYQGKVLIELFDGKDQKVIKNSQPVQAVRPVAKVFKNDFIEKINGEYITYDETVLPVDRLVISSAFGPRLKASKEFAYDFHMGIDIVGEIGDPVYAIADGEVFRVFREGESNNPYPNGGNVIIVRHYSDSPINSHGRDFDTYYSIYMHINESLVSDQKEGGQYPKVEKGQQIATVGNSGTTEFSHLHFETRVGTTCSYSFQISNPDLSCASTWASPQEPHVNPFSFLPYVHDKNFEYRFENNAIIISSDRQELDFNHFEARRSQGDTIVIDFNSREGLNLDSIDDNIFNGYRVSPSRFNKDSLKYEIGFEFDDIDDYNEFILTDIWGDGVLVKR